MEKNFTGKSSWDLAIQVTKKRFIQMGVSDMEKACGHTDHIIPQISEVLKKGISKEARIRKNPDLSQEGKEKADRHNHDETSAKLDAIEEKRNVNLRIADINRKLATAYQPPKTDDVLIFLKQSKMEEQLRKFKPYEMDKIFLDACKKGGVDNFLIIDTVVGCHPMFPLVNGDKIEEGMWAIKERKFPLETRELKDLEAIEKVVGGLFRAAREVIN